MPRGLPQLPEGLRQRRSVDGAQTELVDPRTVDEKAIPHPVEPSGRRGLAPQAIARNLADRRFAAERAKDRALADAGVPGEQRPMAANEVAKSLDVLPKLGIDDDRVVADSPIELLAIAAHGGLGQVGLRQDDRRADALHLGESKKLVQRNEPRRRIGQRGDRDQEIDVRGHRFCAPSRTAPLQCERTRFYAIDDCLSVFKETHGNDVAWDRHKALAGHPPQLRGTDAALAVDRNPRGVLSRRHDKRSLRRSYAQDCALSTANDETNVVYLTLIVEEALDEARRAAVNEVVASQGGSALWRVSPSTGRSYAIFELPDECDRTAIERAAGPTLRDGAIIALAVSPAVAEALPHLCDALGGPGRPAGIIACLRNGDAAIVEWDPEITTASIVLGLVDVELRRFASGRTAELLSPIPAALAAKLAAGGLRAPQIEPARILELRMPRA